MRGFFGGFGLGVVVAVTGVAALSLVMPLPPRPDVGPAPAAAVPETPADRGDDQAGLAAKGNDADLVEAMPRAPLADHRADDLNPLASADTAPAEKPSVGGATEMLSGPQEEAAPPAVDSSAAGPDVPKTPAAGPEAPGADRSISITADPAQPAAPALPETDSGFAALEEATPEVGSDEDEAATSAPDAGTIEPIAGSVEAASGEGSQAPRIAALPQAGTEAVVSSAPLGTPVKPMIETDTPPDAAPAAAETALALYSVPFDNPDHRPLLSVVLIDDAQSIGAEALADFPYPLTFAIDPSEPDAGAKMQRYRDAGFEVVMLADLPAAATPQDAEVSIAVWRTDVPEAVAILEGTGSGIQGNRQLSDQVTEIARSAGLGLITLSNGLNTVQKLAAREGVPSAVVFRDFDGAGQTPTVMRRFLDQAAFRAGQEGAVIMLGRVRPDTVSALLIWGLQDRAQRVALAPVSAVLTYTPGDAAQE